VVEDVMMHRAVTSISSTIGRPRVMGILNVTPDSFSDGGRWADTEAAIAHGVAMLDQGADIIDVGGESTRPGAERPDADQELSRVIPVIAALAEHGAWVSVDTMRSEVAAAAVGVGASIVNDVSGGQADPAILDVVADAGAAYVAMHWRAQSATMQDFAVYDAPGGVVAAVRDELAARVEAILGAGIAPEQLVLDPGLGFAKNAEHNWALVRGLHEISALGFPLLIGASRKAFLGALLAAPDGTPRSVNEREAANTALTVLLAQQAVWGLRVHEVRSCRDALAVWTRVGDREPVGER
jgi:dihydropteroate synthase